MTHRFPFLFLFAIAALATALQAAEKNEDAQEASKNNDAAATEQSVPRWIWLDNQPAQDDQTVFFRKEFTAPRGRITGAKLYASCDNAMEIFLNGQKVVESDQWNVPVFKDVREQIRRGKNVLAVRGRNSGGPAGLLVRLVLEAERQGNVEVVTDGAWRAADKPAEGWQEIRFNDQDWQAAVVVGKLGDAPWNSVNEKSLAAAANLREPSATPPETLNVAEGFRVELLYSVPKDEQGSWVNMAVDPRGRLIVSDQYGGLYRVTPPAIGGPAEATKIEKIPVDIGEAQGLLWAFDSLYVVVNTGGVYASGVYRVRDTDGDDELDQVELLRKLEGKGEHGPHAVLLAPDGKSLYIVCGNGTKLTDMDSSRVPRVWDEDLLLPRAYGRGFMKGVPAPGGYIARIDPDGKHWELVATGFRNEFDAAFNRDGELFTYDADMEWDMNTPWYRPTRVCHVVSGAEFGWRNGSGKWPPYFPDSVPPVINIGPGSPTGVTFGYGARFPAKYQDALFICDWSYGILYAVHLRPNGASYQAEIEKFITGTPLPLTDIVVNRHDGAMYFAIGGRRTKSGLYRVTYVGADSTAPVTGVPSESEARRVRKQLETFHGRQDPAAVDAAWPHLGSPDRFLRWAARVALEHQPPESWQARALKEHDPQALLTSLLALTRVGDESLQPKILASLDRLKWRELSHDQQIELLRVYGLAFLRMGAPDQATADRVAGRFMPHYPAASRPLNAELCKMLVYLQAPGTAEKTLDLLAAAPTQEEQIEYAASLRHLKTGWTMDERKQYFQWFLKAANYKGGASFNLFVQHIKEEAVEHLSEEQREELKPILEARPEQSPTVTVAPPRPFVKEWSLDELTALVQTRLTGRDFDRGRAMFAAANCFACHRFDNEGGAVGPDLTGLAGRFSRRDLLESIVEPSKVISDQYAAVTVLTIDGKVVTGRIVNLAGDSLRINTNMLDPNAIVSVDRKLIEEMVPAKASMMPKGLLNTLDRDEVLDLTAYLLSRGDRNHPMFGKKSEFEKKSE